ncbi:MAG TPA: hypothetical protein VLW83_13645, partial [Candidatus Acidoferrales bacterium]|nr:hypothetical protein [Candidatus Acidoferrales bacterium]
RENFPKAQPLRCVTRFFSIPSVTIAQQIAGSDDPGEGFQELPRHPFSRRMFTSGKANETAAIMRQNYEDEQHLEKGHWGDEKVRRDKIHWF